MIEDGLGRVEHATVLADGSCGCDPPYTPNYVDLRGTKILSSCGCESPNSWGFREGGMVCLCPKNQALKNGQCVPCTDRERYKETPTIPYQWCIPCTDPGTKADQWHENCVPACDASKGEYFDFDTHVCKQCVAGSKVVYVNKEKTSLGHCELACSAGQVFTFGVMNQAPEPRHQNHAMLARKIHAPSMMIRKVARVVARLAPISRPHPRDQANALRWNAGPQAM